MPTSREDIRLGSGQTFRLLRWTNNVREVEEITAPGETIPLHGRGDHWHYHPETELTLVQEGEGTRFIADHIELFDSGDLVLIGSNVPHYWHLRGKSSGLAIQWHFPLEHGIWDFREAAPLRELEEAARWGIHIKGATAAAIRKRMEDIHTHTGLSKLASFLTIASTLASAPESDVRRLAQRPFSLSGTDEQQEAVRRAVSYIIAHYKEQVKLPELLQLTGMSRATFSRQFQLHAGRSFSTFINQVRLKAVCRALRETSGPITNIALEHGFNQLSFFNRLFRRELNMSPSDYRSKVIPTRNKSNI